MHIKIKGITYIYDLDIDFIMRQVCYQNGMNCYNCLEGCDTLDILEQLHKEQEKTGEES